MQFIAFATGKLRPLKSSGTKLMFTGLVLASAFMCAPGTLKADGPLAVDLGSAAHFTILAGAGITTTGGGTVNGDVGAYPITGAAIGLTQAQVNGTIYAVDATGPPGSVVDAALLLAAKGDLTTAINAATARTPIPVGAFLNPGLIPGAGNIGGMTLVPGLYKFTGTALITGGNVTLTGGPNDVWIFQIADDLQVGTSVHVILAGGAQARNIFWQVGTSVAIGTFAVFKGTILANQGIVMNTTSSMEGRALSFTASVTFDGSVSQVPAPTAPEFASISRTATNSVLVLNTAPYFLVTVQSSPSLSAPNWTTMATNTPITSLWTMTNNTAAATQRFYRAFITTP